jgi:hypothetical protein
METVAAVHRLQFVNHNESAECLEIFPYVHVKLVRVRNLAA